MSDPTLYSLTVEDDGGVRAVHNKYVSFDGALTTIDDLIADLGAYAILVDNISDGKVIEARVTIPLVPTGVKGAPVADSTVERTGLFTYSQANSSYVQSLDIPAYFNAGITNGRIDETNLSFQGWNTTIVDTAAQFRAVSKFANDLLARLSTKLTFRKHRRARIKSSYETP